MQMWMWDNHFRLIKFILFYLTIILGFPSYTGQTCEILMCDNQPPECNNPNYITVDECSDTRILTYCPSDWNMFW